MDSRHGLQRKILALSVLLLLIPMTVYFLFTVRTLVDSSRKNFEEYTALSMRKVGASLESVLNDLDRTSLFIIGSRDIRDYLSVEKDGMLEFSRTNRLGATYNALSYLKNTNPYISAIQIQGFNGAALLSGPLPMSISPEDAERALALNGRAFWDVDADNGSIYLCRLLRHAEYLDRKLGYIKIYLNTALLGDFLHQEAGGSTAYYYLIDESGSVRFTTAPSDQALPADLFPPAQLSLQNGASFPVRLNGERLYLAPHTLAINGWTACGVYYSAAVNGQAVSSVVMLLLLVAAAAILCLLLAYQLSRRILGPLWEIVRNMRSLEEENFSVRIAVTGADEVSVLAGQFNRMAEKIQSLINEVYKVKLYKKESELRALQAQVNPHFLYNTLDMIYWTASMERAARTGGLISALSKFFRSGLTPVGDFTTVHNEVEHLRYYMVLRQESRQPVKFHLDMDPEAEWCSVVKLVLQPLVENALIHGVGERENGRVEVSIARRGGQLVYSIRDDGPGVDEADMARLLTSPLESTRGFGIQNVNDRIRLAYGPGCGLTLKNRPEGGTEALVILPFRKGERND